MTTPEPHPADLTAVNASDALLDRLGGRTPPNPGSAVHGPYSGLDALLAAWRREVDARPVGELVDTDTAITEITTAARSARHPWWTRLTRILRRTR